MQGEAIKSFFEQNSDAIDDQLIAQQPIKRLGIHPPKISEEHAGLLQDQNLEMIEEKAKLEGEILNF